jgi:hypothetical protein
VIDLRPAAAAALVALAAALVAAPCAVAGPLDAGTRVVTGSIAFSSAGGGYYADEGGNRTEEWSLQPGGGMFVADGLALNLLAAGTWYRQGSIVSNHYEFGPTVEYYLQTFDDDKDVRGRAVPYLGTGVLWGRARTESAGVESAWNSVCGLARVGLAWMVLDRVASDIAVVYRFGSYEQKQPVDGDKEHGNRWTVNWGMKVFLP